MKKIRFTTLLLVVVFSLILVMSTPAMADNGNNAPTDITLSNNSVYENSPSGTVVGQFSTVDQDGGPHTYALVEGAGDADNNSFDIVDNELVTNAVFDYETKPTCSIRVITIDGTGLHCSEAFTIIFIDGNETPIAYISSIWPNPATEGRRVIFHGYGTDQDGRVDGYNWRSSIDGQLSTQRVFVKHDLSVGTHTIYFKVRDNNGVWSDEVSQTLEVEY